MDKIKSKTQTRYAQQLLALHDLVDMTSLVTLYFFDDLHYSCCIRMTISMSTPQIIQIEPCL